jgi:hypothetical protein
MQFAKKNSVSGKPETELPGKPRLVNRIHYDYRALSLLF